MSSPLHGKKIVLLMNGWASLEKSGDRFPGLSGIYLFFECMNECSVIYLFQIRL